MGKGMMLLSKDAILATQDLPTEDVHVPEWGGTVRVKSLSGAERDAWEASVTKRKGKSIDVDTRNIRAKLVGLCLVDEEGARLFDDSEMEALGHKSASALDRLFSVCQRLNGLTDRDVADLEENFTFGQNGHSTSG